MSLHIRSSAYYLKIANRVIDKITNEYNPPRYWFRIKVVAKGCLHRKVRGYINDIWWSNYRRVKDFDPLTFLWLNEPLQIGEPNDVMISQYYAPDIPPGSYELAGLLHSKLPMNPVDPNMPLPKENIPDEQLPEVEFNQSLNEPVHVRKRRIFPYGIYYAQVVVTDFEGKKATKIFKVWAAREPKKCKIRSTRFYERFMLKIKSLLPAI